jgi:CheY-like chemotaxis protein
MAKVLVVDDSEFFRTLFTKALTDAGFEVETAENGRQAVDILLASPAELVLLDLVMPVMTGEEALAEIKKHEEIKNVPVIMLTSISVEVKGKELLTKGSLVAYLTKDDVTPEQVVSKAKEVLGTYEQSLDTGASQ